MTGNISGAVQLRIREAGMVMPRVEKLIREALAEDLDGGQDVTSIATVSDHHRSVMDLVSRAGGVVAGMPVAEAVFNIIDATVETTVHVAEGTTVQPGTVLLTAVGNTRSLLQGERTALNLLSHMSGIATHTRQWVDAVEGTGTQIRDTRKTLPGLRHIEKYAVRVGGGVNHRMSLSDAALIKDNHVAVVGSVTEAYEVVQRRFPDLPLQVEVDSVNQLDEALAAGVDSVLLDNFTPEEVALAVTRTGGRAKLEASGGLTLATARTYAQTGVDFLAVGALTHSSPALDIGADLRAED
jgi:nicotinate-nucleotide pyrophosphorylase (carboxylating)